LSDDDPPEGEDGEARQHTSDSRNEAPAKRADEQRDEHGAPERDPEGRKPGLEVEPEGADRPDEHRGESEENEAEIPEPAAAVSCHRASDPLAS
jgi:hypothetical protein